MISSIFYEEEIVDHPRTKFIFSKFKKARKISINRYTEIFNKRDQNFKIQKSSPSLILAKKHSGHVLSAPEGFGIGNSKNYYFSHMYNCLYDCRYCFLQGMYSSANYVLFVNYEDFDQQISQIIDKNKNKEMTFFSGYDCDSLALENITGFASYFLEKFENYPNALIELRTKSIQVEPLNSIEPINNCVVAYSLLPEIISKDLDKKTPSIERRIEAMKKLALKGWRIGLRFDPLIHGKDWKKLYKELHLKVFESLPPESIHSISYGPLRFPKAMFKNIFKLYPKEKLFAGPLVQNSGEFKYDDKIEKEMLEFCQNISKNYIPKSILFNCSPILS